jgi:hypothetical protein
VAHVIDVKAHTNQKKEDETIGEGIGERSDVLAFIMISERHQDPAYRKKYSELIHMIIGRWRQYGSGREKGNSLMAHLCKSATRQRYGWAISTHRNRLNLVLLCL